MKRPTSEEKPASDGYPTVSSTLTFTWLCPACKKVNHVSYDTWDVYQGLEVCGCEQAVRVKEPWK